MSEYWILDRCDTQENYISNNNGEALNYHKNLEQKLINTITLPFVFNDKKNTYSNFTYSNDGKKLAIITKNDDKNNFELIIYIPHNYTIEYEQNLNSIINKDNYLKYIAHDERNFLNKLFGNLTFLRLSQDTNNLYFLSEKEILLTSLDRKIFIFIKLDERNEYKTISENGEDKENENDIGDIIVVKNLEDIIYNIKKNYVDMNLLLSFINKNIDNLINNSIPKNIYMDLSLYTFGQNFFLLVDHNKIILIFYIENNTDNKQYILIFFLNYIYTNNPKAPLIVEEDQKMTLEFPINSSFKSLNILSIIAKIKLGYLVICLSFKDDHFQIILVDMHLRLFKKYISKIFFVPTKRKGNITVITDLFIYDKYCFIIFDFYYIIIFNLISFSLIPILGNNIKEENESKYINIRKLFPKEYNKTFFIEFENVFKEKRNGDNNASNNKFGYLYLNTKKNTKEIKFIIMKNNNIVEIPTNLLSVFKAINKKQNRYITNIIASFNEHELYTYLHFLATFQKHCKNTAFTDNYLFQLLYIINNKIYQNFIANLNSKDGCIKNLLLLNQKINFGIYNSFIRYNFSTIKFFYFIENSEEKNADININYIYEHKIMKNNINREIQLNDYYLSISNNYLILYQIITIIILLIKYENKLNPDILKLYIKSNFIISNQEDRKFILNKFKTILNKINNKKTLCIFNIKKIAFYSTKKKIISEIRNCLININNNSKNNKNFILFESVFVLLKSSIYKENAIEYSINEIKFIKFVLYLISFYLNQIINLFLIDNKKTIININIKIFNLYNINDILYSLDYLNISFEEIYNKYFIKEISFKLNSDGLTSIKELFTVLLILKMIISDDKNQDHILEYFNEYNNIEKRNLIIDPIFFLLLYQNDKGSLNMNKNINSNINKLIISLIEKKIKEIKHNKIFKLIFLFCELIRNNNIFNKELSIERKIVVQYLDKEISLFEYETLKLFNIIFKQKNNKRNFDYIKYKSEKNKEEIIDDKYTLINLIKFKDNPPIFIFKIMNDKFIYIFSIINNIIDILLYILNIIKKENNYNSNINIIELLLEKKNNNNFNDYYYINNNNEYQYKAYYTLENISKLFKKFCLFFWLFNSLFIFIEEINKKLIFENSQETLLISLLHINYYYNKKYPDKFPILQKEILQYLKFYIFYLNKQGNNLSIKLKNIIEIYMDKDFLCKNFNNIFKEKNIPNINKLNNGKESNDEYIGIYDYIKINDFQFDFYLNKFKLLFYNEEKELLKCENDYIINSINKIKNTKYYSQGLYIFNKYNKLLKYNKLIEIIGFDLPIHQNIKIKDIQIPKDNVDEYNPQILFSFRKSIEHLNKNKFEEKEINNLNNYIEIIPKFNGINTSENNTTIINNNTLYSFNNNNNILSFQKKEEENTSTNNNENIKIQLKEEKKFENKTIKVDLEERNRNIYSNQLLKSENLDEFMKRIKNKKNFNYYEDDYNDEEIRYKYLAAKLLIKYFMNKRIGINFFIFKNLKAFYFVNQNNIIQNQINIIINEKEE